MSWAVLTVWVLLGAASAILMIRRGHDATTWIMLGLVLGPVTPLVAIASAGAETRTRPRVLAAGGPAPGSVDIVAGIDGSPEALAALRAAIDLHGNDLGRLVVALVLPYDSDEPDRASVLAQAACAVAPIEPTSLELHGDPANALRRYAADEGLDLIVVGARGRGRSSSPLGSVATRLASGSTVPVLIGPAPSP